MKVYFFNYGKSI